MARHATIIDQSRDLYGEPWDIRESRETTHGFCLLLGWPEGCRGKGYGAPRIVPTKDLHGYWETRQLARDGSIYDLPASRTALKRIRQLMGLNYYVAQEQWWLERIEDLATLSGADFRRKHGSNIVTISQVHKSLFGRRQREPGWYLHPDAHLLLTGPLPHIVVAEKLNISVGASRRLRSILRRTNA